MGPLTIVYLLHNFHNSNYWIIQFFCGSFSFESDKFDCIIIIIIIIIIIEIISHFTSQQHVSTIKSSSD